MFLPYTDSEIGPVSGAMQNRSALVLICVLVALGSLLCVGKESLAKQPGKAPKPAGHATSHRPTNHQPKGAQNPGHRGSAAQPKPARHDPVHRDHSSPQAHQQSKGRAAPAGPTGRARGQRQHAGPSGTRVAPHEKSAHKPTVSREPGSRKPVVSDTARHHPQPKQSNRGHSLRPVHQRPTPQTTPHRSHSSESTQKGDGSPVRQKGAGSQGEHGKPASPPGRENGRPTRQGVTGRPEQAGPPPEHATQAGPNRKANEPTPQEENGANRPGISANRPDGGPSNRVAGGSPDRQPPTRTLAGYKSRSDTRPATQSSYRSAGTTGGTSDPRSMDSRSEGPSSAQPSGRTTVRSTQTVDPVRERDEVPAAPPGGLQRPAGAQAQLAPEAPFASTKLVLDTPWDQRGSLVERTEGVLRSLPGDSHHLSAGTPHKGSLTQRGPPLQVPSPLSPFGPMMVGGAATGSGSSGDGTAPLLAVISLCLIAVLSRGRFRTFCAFLRPGTVPRPALERPG